MAKKKHQAPAKIKYDETHPIISFRCTPALKKKLNDIKKMSDKNVADILKEAVKIQAPSTENAYGKGVIMAKLTYTVTFRCHKCGQMIEVHTNEEKEAARQYMEQHGWAHISCPNK
jgi:hypothetical protein